MIRIASDSDAEEVLRIYAPAVRDSVATLETAVPTLDDMRHRIRLTLDHYPWLVDDAGGALRGFAYANMYRIRQAYQWSVEASIYVDRPFRRQGRGRALYERLFDILRQQGYVSVLAAVIVPNDPSEHLHDSMGFQCVGRMPSVGYKHGRWCDLSWWQFKLQDDRPDHPLPPVPFGQWRETFSE